MARVRRWGANGTKPENQPEASVSLIVADPSHLVATTGGYSASVAPIKRPHAEIRKEKGGESKLVLSGFRVSLPVCSMSIMHVSLWTMEM